MVVAAGVEVVVAVTAGLAGSEVWPPPFFSLIFSLMAATQLFVVCSLSEKIQKVLLAVETVKWYFPFSLYEGGGGVREGFWGNFC